MNDIPQPLNSPDFQKIVDGCKRYVEFFASDEYCADNDYKQYIFEAALEAIYGKDIWARHRQLTESRKEL